MNYIDMLGKPFNLKEDGSFLRSSLEGDEGHGVYTHHVEENNGLWQMNLNDKGIVQTIFLPAVTETALPFGLNSQMQPEDVTQLLGTPNKTGEEQEIEFLGMHGAWLRFDQKDICIHVEFNLGANSIKQVTLMLPEVAP